MSIDCSCDYDPADFYVATKPKARKQHHCHECPATIQPGETYEYVRGCWEGTVSIFKTCQRCVDLRQFVQNNVPCFCWAHGNLFEDMENTIEDAYHRARNEVVGLRFGFLRRVILRDRFNAGQRASLAAPSEARK